MRNRKTRQVYWFGKRNVFRFYLKESREGDGQRGRWTARLRSESDENGAKCKTYTTRWDDQRQCHSQFIPVATHHIFYHHMTKFERSWLDETINCDITVGPFPWQLTVYFVIMWPCLKEDHDSIRWSMVTSRSVHSHGNSSYILSSHDCIWKKIMTWWDNWWWHHSQSVPVATHHVFCHHMTMLERSWWDNQWWCHGRSAPAATHRVFCHYMTELKRRSWHAEMNEGDVTVSLFPQQIITNFVVTQPHLKEDCSSKRQQVSNQQPSNPRTLFRHGQATPSPSIPTVTPLHPAPPPLPPHHLHYTPLHSPSQWPLPLPVAMGHCCRCRSCSRSPRCRTWNTWHTGTEWALKVLVCGGHCFIQHASFHPWCQNTSQGCRERELKPQFSVGADLPNIQFLAHADEPETHRRRARKVLKPRLNVGFLGLLKIQFSGLCSSSISLKIPLTGLVQICIAKRLLLDNRHLCMWGSRGSHSSTGIMFVACPAAVKCPLRLC